LRAYYWLVSWVIVLVFDAGLKIKVERLLNEFVDVVLTCVLLVAHLAFKFRVQGIVKTRTALLNGNVSKYT
jgi:hypothetical protein